MVDECVGRCHFIMHTGGSGNFAVNAASARRSDYEAKKPPLTRLYANKVVSAHTMQLPHFKFIPDAPDRTDGPVLMILDFLAQALNMYVNCACIADIFIAPDMVEKLFPGKNLVG